MKKSRIVRQYLAALIGILLSVTPRLSAQTSVSTIHFIDYQRSIPKISDLLNRKEDTLIKQFREKGLTWPARYVYIRSFKYDSQLEVWVKNAQGEKYQLFKTYKVCALAGTLGPKRMQGDYQVPEGFYYINEFKPRSEYHLSLGLNYPNASDRILSDSSQPGGDIYIHGSCVTTGCIPITDAQIEELYILAAHAKDMGEDFIPVHIFPVNFNNARSVEYLNKYLQTFAEYTPFAKSMRNAFYYFEKYREVPFVMVNGKGEYVTEEEAPEAEVKVANVEPVKTEKKVQPQPRAQRPQRVNPIKEDDLAKVVDKLPVYPGGNGAFQEFLNGLSKKGLKDLDQGQTKTFVMVEYVIDQGGKPVYAKVIRGGNENMNEKIEDAFLAMPQWSPASRLGKNVAIRLKQTLMIGAD
ncbi:MAG TPA: L,D-transpeptidase family protein [Puia sp.]|nr:L,D-transpeptidase family protein [Puia sp.]